MKHSIRNLFAGIILTCASLQADVDFTDYSAETLPNLQNTADEGGPLSIRLSGDYIGESKFKSSAGLHHRHINFSEAEVDLGLVYYHDASCGEAANIELTWNVSRLKWNDNPYFSQRRYNTLSVALGFFTQRFCDWLWQAQVSVNLDWDHRNFNQYTTYDMLLWGRYGCTEAFGLNVGFLATTGMKADRVVPVLGFDWQICETWKLNAVFPVNMALIYKIDQYWSFALAGRVFYSRYRVGKDEPLSRGIWEYRNSGVELALNYDMCKRYHVNIHIGETLGGQIKVSNRQHKHGHRYKFRAAGYFGAEMFYRF